MKKNFCKLGAIRLGLGFALLVSGLAFGQMRSIRGSVTDRNKPLSGVTVRQKGTDISVLTDKEGRFQLEVNGKDAVLEFEHPDYEQVTERIGQESRIKVMLSKVVNKIEEVLINAGYYTVKDKERTGSIAKVTAKDIENQPVNNVLSAVQGRMAGVSITQSGGTAGAGYDIQIRGRNSLRNKVNSLNDGNEPLYVVDGVPFSGQLSSTYSVGVIPLKSINPLNSINPNDIESIEILKDADATAIYGSRGGNGVVLITTKKGKPSAVRLTLNSSQAVSSVARKLVLMDNVDYIAMRKQAFANAGINTYPDYAYDINGAWGISRNTDWQKELIGRTADNFNIQIGISGGSEKNSFSINAGHNDQTSVFPGDHHYKLNSLSSHFNHKSDNNRFSLGWSNNIAFSSNNNLNTDYTKNAFNLAPNAPALYDSNGNLNWQNGTFSNPLSLLKSTYSNKTRSINQNINLSYNLWSNINVKLNTGLNFQDLEEYSLSPNTMYSPASVSSTSSAYSSSSRGTSSVFSYLLEPQLSWMYKQDKHEWSALLGATFQDSQSKQTAMRGVGFASNALIKNIAAASAITLSPFVDTHYRYAAFFGRLNYSYQKKYIINLTARRDGSSRFGTNNKFANFAAIGAAWLLSEEQFLKNLSWLSFAKLRGSYGKTGSDSIGDYQYLDTYTLSTLSYNNVPGLYPSRLFNPDFSWEKTTKMEAALEMGLLNDRINLTAAWYRNRSSNQLVGIPLPATTGFPSLQANLSATVENKGYELELAVIPVKTNEWKWTSNFNISIPQNKLLEFPGLKESSYANTYEIGASIYAVKLLEYVGINSNGQYEFTDFNQDGKITAPEDAKVMRDLSPKYFGGLQNSISYKNFNMSFLFQFVKQDAFNYFRTMGTPGNMANQPKELLNVWSPSNPNGIIMPYSTGTDAVYNNLNNNFKNSTAAVSDASFIRLKNVQINYRIPIENTWMREAKVYVQGQNLWTITKYFGLDPEYITSGYLPPLKTFSVGLQFTF